MAASKSPPPPSAADGKPSEDEAAAKPPPAKNVKDAGDPDSDLTDEDRALKENLDMLAERSRDSDAGVAKLALETIRREIRSATSSMTSVPKPLKFLRPHFPALKEYYATAPTGAENTAFLADVLAVLAMTMGDENIRESLHFKLHGTPEACHTWGHEFVRHLAGEIAREYEAITVPQSTVTSAADPATMEQLNTLIDDIVPFLISSNAEPEAVDLLMEVDSLAKLPELADEHNFGRVCRYLKACASFTIDADDTSVLLSAAADIYAKVDRIPDALQVALRLGDTERIERLYASTAESSAERVQVALDLGAADFPLAEMFEEDENLRGAINNRRLFEYFQHLAKDLDVLEPKIPEDIYKTHLIDSRAAPGSGASDSARANLASTFVNAFVNMGFGTDKLLSNTEKPWIYSNKDHGMMSAAASLGMIMQWDVDTGLSEIDKYMYADREYVRAGALLSVGILSAGVRHEVDPALALLMEHVESETPAIRNGAISGLGIAYAGSSKEDVKELLVPIVADSASSADSAALAALSLGLVFVGTADEDLSATLIQALSDRKDTSDVETEAMLPTLMPLALGLLFLGKQEAVEAVSQTIEAMVGVDTMLGRVTAITLQACAYAGTGNVSKVQNFLTICGEHHAAKAAAAAAAAEDVAASAASAGPAGANSAPIAAPIPSPATMGTSTDASKDSTKLDESAVRAAEAEQMVAVLGIAMVAMGEELGAEMSLRAFAHLMQYGDPAVRRVVPLAIGLLSISKPSISLMDTLSKFTHDADLDVVQSAIFALGMIGAGTNNSRIAGLLRQLSAYYGKEPAALFLVRIAQGMLHAGKGLVTMSPFYGDNKFLCKNLSLSGMLTVLFSCLDMKGTILGKSHYLLYFLSLSARPRMVFTVDENMEFISTSVRVGQAVDTVGQAGRPKSITGFQTHTTPVLLAAGERAELATEEYLSVASSMEGVVVLKKNPDFVADDASLLEKAVAKQAKEEAAAEALRDAEKAAAAAATAAGMPPPAAPVAPSTS
jgi:26S proteasome regulatory subunit N1